MNTGTAIRLRIPRQDHDEFSRFVLSQEGAQEWAAALPVANTRQTVVQLRDAISELNRVQLTADTRFNILEALFPRLEITLANLARRFLNQPLILPEEPLQFSELAENLYSLFSTAYTIVAVHAIQQRKALGGGNPARLACQALQRALEFTGQRMLQTYQLQQRVEAQGWSNLHQLYALGELQGLDRHSVQDIHQRQTTLQATYLRPILLSCAKANQLRQSDLSIVYTALALWSEKVVLRRDPDEAALFAVDLAGDQPSVYHKPGADTHKHYRYLDTRGLVAYLELLRDEDRSQGRRGIDLGNKQRLPSNLLEHLIAALGSRRQRNFSRHNPGEAEIDVAIGLSSVHYHTAGQKTFEDILPPKLAHSLAAGADPFAPRDLRKDPWTASEPEDIFRGEDSPLDPQDDHRVSVDEKAAQRLENFRRPSGEDRYLVYSSHALNASPGGYCLEWEERAPRNLRNGELLCLRDQGQSDWLIGAVRWMSALENARTLLGVELLSPRGLPYAAQIIGSRGERGQPVRVLLLPEIKLVGKPQTLITPNAGFREHQKLILLHGNEELVVELQQQIGTSASFSEFDFRYVQALENGSTSSPAQDELPRSSFNSIWADI